MKILIYLTSLYKDLLIQYSEFLTDQGHDVVLICNDNDIKNYVKKRTQNNHINIENILDLENEIEKQINSISNNLKKEELYLYLEKFYEKKFSYIISQERYIERGHIHTISYKNYHKNQFFSRVQKFDYVAKKIKLFEKVIEDYKPDLIFCFQRFFYLDLVCKKKKVDLFHFAPARFGNLYFVCDKFHNNSSILEKSISENLNKKFDDKVEDILLEQVWYGTKNNQIRFSKLNLIKNIINFFLKGIKQNLSKKINNNLTERVSSSVWIQNEVNGYLNFKKYLKFSKNKKLDINTHYAYFSLHMEPEKTTQHFANEFNNSLEIITWISKCLPANYFLVIKEHPKAFNMRDNNFYEKISSISNVILASPYDHSWELIKGSSFVVGINGTSITEAVYLKKEVISYVDNMFFNLFTTVYSCKSYFDTKKIINKIIQTSATEIILNNNRNTLIKSINEHSFEIENIQDIKYGKSESNIFLFKEITKRINDFLILNNKFKI